jgi:hypothetical protein
MQELRFVAVSEDGRYAVLAVPGRSARFTLPIDERLRAVALGQTSRLAQYEIEVESPLRPKEIQARMRAGETAEEIADAAGIAVERVRWFEGPVLAERAYMADQAQAASVRRLGEAMPSTPGPRLGEVVSQRMSALGADPEDAQWDAKKRGDGSWLVELTFTNAGRLHVAEWVFDPRRRHVLPADDNAARMSLPGAEPLAPAAPRPGEATVTPLAPRLTAGHHAAPQPNGTTGPGSDGWGRHERSGTARPMAQPAPPAFPPQPLSAQAPSAPIVAEPRGEVPRQPVAGRSPQPSAVPADETVARHAMPVAEAVTPPVVPAAETVAPPTVPAAETVTRPAVRPAETVARHAMPADETVAPAAETVVRPSVPAAEAVTPAGADEQAQAQAAAPVLPVTPEPTSEQAGRPGRKAARGKRSSVPSWDEIMFGSSRQRD